MKKLLLFLSVFVLVANFAFASSHREAPLISNDPLADNTDLYAFVSPDDPTRVTIIAGYIPFELPEGGPNYYTFGENINYEIHIRNQAAVTKPGNGDDITYRFNFTQMNEDPSTFFNIRLGKQNLKTTYTVQRSVDGGVTWTTVITDGVVPPTNIGPRSIDAPGVGLGMSYEDISNAAIKTASTGSKVFCGPADDPFFVDLAGIFDLGNFRKKDGSGAEKSIDAVRGFNCHVIALQIPINLLQKDGKDVSQAANILDGDFVIGVWASASRPRITTLSTDGSKPTYSSDYVQVSRLGMPLTNEAIIPIGMKDKWNSSSPYDRATEGSFEDYFTNLELTLYTGGAAYSAYGGAIPSLEALKVDSAAFKGAVAPSGFDFRLGKDGLFPLKGTSLVAGTALDDAAFGGYLLRAGKSRSVDILPIFYTGVPNLPPYQLATGKAGVPVATGKPFINNFLPTLGDMLRLNMATPPTSRTSADFSNLGLIQAAVLGLLDPRFNADASVQNIPNMDGFPNGRRLEDDVTRIEMQAVGGLVLNAIGLWADDYAGSLASPQVLAKYGWDAGVNQNDKPFRTSFPYVALPHRGADGLRNSTSVTKQPNGISVRVPDNYFTGSNYPNPVAGKTSMRYHINEGADVTINILDVKGTVVETIMNSYRPSGEHELSWTPKPGTAAGAYTAQLSIDGIPTHALKITVTK